MSAGCLQCVCSVPSRTMCCTLSMTKCQCQKAPAQSAPLCRAEPRSTLAVRLAALRRNNTLPPPRQKSTSSSFPLSTFLAVCYLLAPPPVDFSLMSSLRTQANPSTCKLLRNAPPTQSGRWIGPKPANSANALVSLYLFCLVWMQSNAARSLHHSHHWQQSVCPSILPTRTSLPAGIYC